MLQVLIHDHVFPEIRMSYCENRELIILIGVGKSECLVALVVKCTKHLIIINYSRQCRHQTSDHFKVISDK